MKIGIVGGGITGLTACYELSKLGHTVTVYERDMVLGGLAHGIQKPNWDWSLEKAYHHLFTNDAAIISLIWELGRPNLLLKYRPITSSYANGHMYQLDSPQTLLSFPGIPLIDRIRTGVLLGLMKANPFWQPLEHITAASLFRHIGGTSGWKAIWEPLMRGKFGPYADTVAASWLWARIKKRTPSLYYIAGGFAEFIDELENACLVMGATIHTQTQIQKVTTSENTHQVTYLGQKSSRAKTEKFDALLLTTPSPIAAKLLQALPKTYQKSLLSIPHLYAQVLILETPTPILKDVYWLNVTDRSFPFLAVVAHTNMVNPAHYGGNLLTYIGNYLPEGHHLLKLSKPEVLKLYLPFLRTLAKQKHPLKILDSSLFVAPYAQPVHEKHYSSKAPSLHTPISGVYIANMDSVFPWDRGTNYAVELGQKAAKTIQEQHTAK